MAMTGIDSTDISASSICRVLEGVVVALKAPEKYATPLINCLNLHGLDSRCDSPIVDEVSYASTTLPFCAWLQTFSSAGFSKATLVLARVSLAVALMREKARADIPLDASTLDTIWSLVNHAIMSSRSTDIKFSVTRSAQGFLAIPLCSLIIDGRIDELWRLHTWLPDNCRGVNKKVAIHSHQPFGQSWILLGSGTDCSFDVDTLEDPEATTHALYECCFVGADGKMCGPRYQTHQSKSIIRNTGRHVRVRETGRATHVRDESYSVAAGEYHRSIVPGRRLHATFFVFDSQRGYDDTASVLGPKDDYEYDQPRDPAGITAETLAQIVTATRKREQERDVLSVGQAEDPTELAYYRYFQGLALLQADRRDEALDLFNTVEGGCTVAQAFAREPSSFHREYLQKLVEAGAIVDTK